LNAILVDDEIVAVNALKRRVDWSKYGIKEVFIANSMEQAQAIFKNEKIDLILCDIEMPGGNGLELYEWVKLYYPTTECIYVTCHPDFEYIRKALQLGSADYILKPIDYEELDGVLIELVKRIENKIQLEVIPEGVLYKIAEQESKENHNDIVHKAKRYLLEHIQETISVEDVAQKVHINPQYLMRLFKKDTGISILEFVTQKRIEIAKELLESTDLSINRVADSVGYGNYSYFTKIFKRETGLTPSEYRDGNSSLK
jgi:YesN/AraC family two-component response regulator